MRNIQLANNLRYLRKQRNLTQKNVSQMLNISRQAYSNYETNKRTPDLDSLLHLAQFYCVRLDDLVLDDLRSPDGAVFGEGRVPYNLSTDKNTGNSIYLTEEELEFISQFRGLSSENKQIIAGFLKSNSQGTD